MGRLFAISIVLVGLGCRQDMHNQPRYEVLTESTFFADGKSARPEVEGTVARGEFYESEAFYSGRSGTQLTTALPVTLDRALIERGQSRFDIFCSPCHGRVGDGDGMIVQRGLRQPPSFHIARLREAPVGHYFDVVSNGFGAMPGYASRIKPRDRWAIIAYVRALQLSQRASVEDVPIARREELRGNE